MRRSDLTRGLALVSVPTLVLTASFVGVLALISGGTPGLGLRLPVYVVVMAVTFLGTVFLAERQAVDGGAVLATAVGLSLAAFAIVALAGEGAAYAVRHPERVFESTLLLYLLAAALIGTGLGYWGVNHWREFSARTGDVRL